MTADNPRVLEALRLPELCRRVCLSAGIPLAPGPDTQERFVLRSGSAPPGLLAGLLEEAFVEDEAEVLVWLAPDPVDFRRLAPGQLVVRPGFDGPCPAEELARAGGGPALLFAVERHDADGGLLGVTWAALPEEEPAPEAGYRAAVLTEAAPAAGAHQL